MSSRNTSDFDKLDQFLRRDFWSGLRSLRRYFLTYEKKWLYTHFVRINLKPNCIDHFMNNVVSTNWMVDLIMLNLAFILASLYYHGLHYYGRIVFNLYLSLLLHGFGFLPRELPPNRLDQRLIPRAHSLLGGYACQDTWVLTSCVSGILLEMHYDPSTDTRDIKSMAWAIGLCMYICFFGYSRVWSISRFHHTVVMGVLGALIGNVLYYFFCENLRSIRQQNQIFATTVASIGLFVWLLVNIESNSANGFGIPKAEYIRVLGDIMNNDATVTMGGGDDRYQQIASQRARQALLRQRREINKKDGFVAMMEKIEKRNIKQLRSEDQQSTFVRDL